MLRVNIWFLNRIPAPSETERNSGLCPWLLNMSYSAALQRNKEEKLTGFGVLERSSLLTYLSCREDILENISGVLFV